MRILPRTSPRDGEDGRTRRRTLTGSRLPILLVDRPGSPEQMRPRGLASVQPQAVDLLPHGVDDHSHSDFDGRRNSEA
jgi:hypothetical protein